MVCAGVLSTANRRRNGVPICQRGFCPCFGEKDETGVPADKANLKGTAVVCGIVAPDGRIRTTFMDRSIGNGLDEIAIATVKQWKFRPAMKDGEPVAAPVSLELKFGE